MSAEQKRAWFPLLVVAASLISYGILLPFLGAGASIGLLNKGVKGCLRGP